MSDLRKTFETLTALGGKLEDLIGSVKSEAHGSRSEVPGLQQITEFGENPGGLRLMLHVPRRLAERAGLVVALHGCSQSAAHYAHGTGWSTLAERHGFVVVYPEQHAANNPNSCFSWFNPGDIRRGRGEVASIRSMIAHAVSAFGIDSRRVFVSGLSAGGAMTSALLAAYPEVFAAGAIIGGLPYGCASNAQEALETMFSDVARHDARVLSDRVRVASRHEGAWPRVSVWHGTADPIVKFVNGEQTVQQWTGVHGLSDTPDMIESTGRHTRRVWTGASGDVLVEAYDIAGMAHGVPIDLARGPQPCGADGPFFLDVGLCSTRLSAVSWGLAPPDALETTSRLEAGAALNPAPFPPAASPGSSQPAGQPASDPAGLGGGGLLRRCHLAV